MKIRAVGAELFRADRQTDGHDETKSRFFAILRKSALKMNVFRWQRDSN